MMVIPLLSKWIPVRRRDHRRAPVMWNRTQIQTIAVGPEADLWITSFAI
jgi:hypothetical protein